MYERAPIEGWFRVETEEARGAAHMVNWVVGLAAQGLRSEQGFLFSMELGLNVLVKYVRLIGCIDSVVFVVSYALEFASVLHQAEEPGK